MNSIRYCCTMFLDDTALSVLPLVDSTLKDSCPDEFGKDDEYLGDVVRVWVSRQWGVCG